MNVKGQKTEMQMKIKSQKTKEMKSPQANPYEAPISSSTCHIHFYILLTQLPSHFTDNIASAPEGGNARQQHALSKRDHASQTSEHPAQSTYLSSPISRILLFLRVDD